jgi:hypothetical protein
VFSFNRTISGARSRARALVLILCVAYTPIALARQSTPATARVVGTIQAISGNSLTVISDSGTPSAVIVEPATKFLQIEPGKTDLKEATPLSFAELRAGDRALVRGVLSDDGRTIRAGSVIAVKKALLAEKQAKERAEWQRGVGGLVRSIHPSTSIITITTNNLGVNTEVSVHFTSDTLFRRYASDSTRFDAAKIAPLADIKPGDQLRARGNRGARGDGGDGGTASADFNAIEIISGAFRNIAGAISSSDAATNTLIVQDLASKTAVTLKITPESQMRKLPAQFAEGLAARLRNQSSGPTQASAAASPAEGRAAEPTNPNAQQGTSSATTQNGRGDFQQMIARMPPSSISDLQKGDAVMVVTTEGNGKDPLTVITLLSGVEALLRASPKGGQDMILSPWSLGAGEPSAPPGS